MRLSAYIDGLGILGPGFSNWPGAAAVLSGQQAYRPAATVLPAPTILPAAERRRTGRVVKVALGVALEATAQSGEDPRNLASVFSSSGADGHNCHEICQALSLPGREISPTRFANSVHNAASGYWSIATGAMAESNVLCAFDASFGAGLLEALAQVAVDEAPVLLVAYDSEYPQPLHAKRPVADAFGVALLLIAPAMGSALPRLRVSLSDAPAATMDDAGLESLRASIPAARSLPLLERLAQRRAGTVLLDYLDTARLAVEVQT